MIRLSRRVFLAAPALLGAASARAQGVLPARGVRIIIGYPVGGGTDEMARVIAAALQQRLSRPVTIENRPGAAGAAVGEILKKAPTDGSVLGFIPTATLVGRLTTKSFPFDPQTDLMPLTLVGTYPTGLRGVAQDRRFIPGRLWQVAAERGSRGRTFRHDLAAELHPLLRPDGRPRTRPAARGRLLQGCLADDRRPRAGKDSGRHQRPHLAAPAPSRLAAAHPRQFGQSAQQDRPDIPTVVELGYPTLELQNWYAFFGPTGLSAEVAAAWERELRATLDSRDTTELPDPARPRRRDIDRRAMRQATGSRHGALAVDP